MLPGITFIAVVVLFVWGVFAFVARRERAWKEAAAVLARELAGAFEGSSTKSWTEDMDVYEWEEAELKLTLSGGSKSIMPPGAGTVVPVTAGVFFAEFQKPLPFHFWILRGSCELTGDTAFDDSCKVEGDEERALAFLRDVNLRMKILSLVDSSIRNVEINEQSVVVRCFSLQGFRGAVLLGLEVARALANAAKP